MINQNALYQFVLLVASYPDVEVLGCGEIMARHGGAREKVQHLIDAEVFTLPQQQRNRLHTCHELSHLAEAAHAVVSPRGAAGVEVFDLSDHRLDFLDRFDLIKRMEHRDKQYQPQAVVVGHAGDVNVDHCI